MHNLETILPEGSWFRRWLGIWPTAEPPKTYLLASAMNMLGGCLGRSIHFDLDYAKLWPMLNVLLIGPSGIGKTTSIQLGVRLVRSLPTAETPQIIGGAPTVERLHFVDLKANSQAIMLASELANFFPKAKYMEGLIPYVTELLDYEPIEKRSRVGDIVRIDKPTVTLIGGSTAAWLQEQLPNSAVTGGFLARFLIVVEEHKGQKVALPGMVLGKGEKTSLEKEREGVFREFRELLRIHFGPIGFRDYEAADVFCDWYNDYRPLTGLLAPFAERAREFILRISMLLAISCKRSFILKEDVRAAISLYELSTRKLQDIVVPLSIDGKLLSSVLQVLGKGEVEEKQLYRAMRNLAPVQKVQQLLQSLVLSGDIKRQEDGKYFRLKGV